uniref:Uncharacterized protein n=1 Tax=Arundo donax TaxID=35708 RepID=A0A0A9JRT0_ARUDO
MLGPKPNPSME